MAYTIRFIQANLPYLLQGALTTLWLSALASVIGVLLGIVGALFRLSRVRVLQFLSIGYIEVFRNTPFIVQLFFFYFVLPDFGIMLDPLQTALTALSVNAGAFLTEIMRAGIESVHKSQVEAALSLGLTWWQCFRSVILPPAMRVVAPPLGNQFISVVLTSSIVSQVSAPELTYNAFVLEARTFRSFYVFAITVVLYLVFTEVLKSMLYHMNLRIFRQARRTFRLPHAV